MAAAIYAAAKIPAWKTSRKKRCVEKFIKLRCVKSGYEDADVIDVFNFDWSQLDIVKMKAHILDCVAALGVVQQEFVDQKMPMVLNKGEQPLSAQAQLISNNVFTNVAMSLMLKTLTSEGAEKPEHSESVEELLKAFPDESKLTDGRGWLPLHWAATTDSLEVADMKVLYASDPLALERYHQEGTHRYSDMGFTAAHMMCMQKTGMCPNRRTNRLNLVQHFSVCNQEAFTMSASYPDRGDPLLYCFSALHAACKYGQPTEELLKQLLQLDSSQTKKKCSEHGCLTPLGYLCTNSDCDDRLTACLLDVESSVDVIGSGIAGCLRSTDRSRVLERVEMLLKLNPEAGKYRDASGRNLLHIAAATFSFGKMPSQLCIDIMQRILAIHKDAVREVDENGWLPVHDAARHSSVEVMEFLLGLYPESASMIATVGSQNLLHLAIYGNESSMAKVRFLCSQHCSRYPAIMFQRDGVGLIPLHSAIAASMFFPQNILAVQILYEAGGQEQVRLPVAHPTDAELFCNDNLPLHFLIVSHYKSLRGSPLSQEADCFRMLLSWYPEAAGIEGGVGAAKKTPYQQAVGMGLPPYYLRLLLRAAPDLNPAELHRLNYEERRMAMFLAFRARTYATEPPFLARLRFAKMDLVKHVISFL